MVALVFACKNKGEERSSITESSPPTKEDASLQSELQEQEPLSNEELKAAFPKTIRDLKLDKEPVIVGQTISGHFGGRKLTLGITDTAGENYRVATYFLDALADTNFTDTSETKYIKKDRNGIMTFAKHYIGSHTELEFLYKDRFYISLLSEMEPDELWNAFDIESLSNL